MLKIEKWVERKQRDTKVSLTKTILYVASVVYKGIIAFRHLLYKVRVFPTIKAPFPVISIGNIICGGTGKSEFVAKLISDLQVEGLAILSRGYRSKRKGGARLVADNLDGDEPFMLSKKCKRARVYVGKKREDSAKLAFQAGCVAAILDDGMQYLRLKKDLQIVLVRADDPLGSGFVPYGMRRELVSKLALADYIIIHGASSKENYELVKRELICYSPSKFFGTTYHLEINNNNFKTKKVGVFCGIGNPKAFIEALSSAGLQVVKKKILADHQKLDSVARFTNECKAAGAECVVCTTKDYVKLNPEEKKLVKDIKITMRVSHDTKEYQNLINDIHNTIRTLQNKG